MNLYAYAYSCIVTKCLCTFYRDGYGCCTPIKLSGVVKPTLFFLNCMQPIIASAFFENAQATTTPGTATAPYAPAAASHSHSLTTSKSSPTLNVSAPVAVAPPKGGSRIAAPSPRAPQQRAPVQAPWQVVETVCYFRIHTQTHEHTHTHTRMSHTRNTRSRSYIKHTNSHARANTKNKHTIIRLPVHACTEVLRERKPQCLNHMHILQPRSRTYIRTQAQIQIIKHTSNHQFSCFS